ncbi:MAG: hypothetical protein ACFB15_01255 [Cyclobacteriaceae bacterium]
MKKLLILLAAWGFVCLLSSKDQITLSQQETTATSATDTLEVLTYHQVSSPERSQPSNSSDNSLFLSGR